MGVGVAVGMDVLVGAGVAVGNGSALGVGMDMGADAGAQEAKIKLTSKNTINVRFIFRILLSAAKDSLVCMHIFVKHAFHLIIGWFRVEVFVKIKGVSKVRAFNIVLP